MFRNLRSRVSSSPPLMSAMLGVVALGTFHAGSAFRAPLCGSNDSPRSDASSCVSDPSAPRSLACLKRKRLFMGDSRRMALQRRRHWSFSPIERHLLLMESPIPFWTRPRSEELCLAQEGVCTHVARVE